MLINRICIAFRGFGNRKKVLSVMSVRAATAVLSWKDKKFWMLWKMDLPANCQQESKAELAYINLLQLQTELCQSCHPQE